jgi:A/G-specific adenine glycosylase
MLQQTQAARVEPLFVAFIRRFPSVHALAAASRADVLRAWAGLGYNRRAVSLHRAAQAVVAEHGGRVPVDPAALRTLPGVGPYTAAAVASIAGGAPVAALDVNVRRIVERVGFSDDQVPAAVVDATAARWLDRDDPGAWNQALMDLGREHCRATPRCEGCPLARWCRWRRVAGTGVVSASRRRQGPFEGSSRQVRGRIVDVLRVRPSAGVGELALFTGFESERVDEALVALVREGVVDRAGRSFRLAG